jgi:transposase InsO family protein
MTQATRQHPNAALTVRKRRDMVDCVLVNGWSVAATARRFQIDLKTVRKWVCRFQEEGESGLHDRSSRPHSSPWSTPPEKRAEILELRAQRRHGAAHLAHLVGLAPSTVQSILNEAGVGRLDRGDRATHPDHRGVVRYLRDRPGELVHVDIKKLPGIPDGGGWRLHGRGQDPDNGHARVGYRYLHTALDDRTRLIYSEILDNEQAATSATFWTRAAAFFKSQGIEVERVLTDNGPCYRSGLWHRACAATGTVVKKTRRHRPQTNGKVERFHRILQEEWAYIRPWRSETERAVAYLGFCHYYNHHRGHGSLAWLTPHQALAHLIGDNLPATHT